MSYKRGTLGYTKWGVTNPWVFADLSQPQRQRGSVSPMVFQTAGPFLKSAHLGLTPEEELKRAERMERMAMVGTAMSAVSLYFAYQFYRDRKLAQNKKKRQRRRRTSR